MDKISDLGYTYDSPEDLFRILQAGYSILQTQNSNALANYLDYGEILIEAYKMWDKLLRKHPDRRQRITWKDWIEKNIGITDGYARELREWSKLFSGYTKFRQLGISFKELYHMKDRISYHLRTNEGFAQFWRQP